MIVEETTRNDVSCDAIGHCRSAEQSHRAAVNTLLLPTLLPFAFLMPSWGTTILSPVLTISVTGTFRVLQVTFAHTISKILLNNCTGTQQPDVCAATFKQYLWKFCSRQEAHIWVASASAPCAACTKSRCPTAG